MNQMMKKKMELQMKKKRSSNFLKMKKGTEKKLLKDGKNIVKHLSIQILIR